MSLPDPPVGVAVPPAEPAHHEHHAHPGDRGHVGSLWSRVATLAGLATFTGYVYLMDPDKGGAYPLCPSKLLLGIDCPACGGLRGTNALLHGRIHEALDHNLLLPLYLVAFAIGLGSWMLPLVGRPERQVQPPRWLLVVLFVVVGAFTIARNLPGPHFAYLASDA